MREIISGNNESMVEAESDLVADYIGRADSWAVSSSGLTSVHGEYPSWEYAYIPGHPQFWVPHKGARKMPRFLVFPDFTGY
jgi:hypothetical protein